MQVQKTKAMANIQARADAALAKNTSINSQHDLFGESETPPPLIQSDITDLMTESREEKHSAKRSKLLPVRHIGAVSENGKNRTLSRLQRS